MLTLTMSTPPGGSSTLPSVNEPAVSSSAVVLASGSMSDSMSTDFHSPRSGMKRALRYFRRPYTLVGSDRSPKTAVSSSESWTMMRGSPFLGLCFALMGPVALPAASGTGSGFRPSSKAVKASSIRQSRLPAAVVGLCFLHLSLQYLTSAEADLAVLARLAPVGF